MVLLFLLSCLPLESLDEYGSGDFNGGVFLKLSNDQFLSLKGGCLFEDKEVSVHVMKGIENGLVINTRNGKKFSLVHRVIDSGVIVNVDCSIKNHFLFTLKKEKGAEVKILIDYKKCAILYVLKGSPQKE